MLIILGGLIETHQELRPQHVITTEEVQEPLSKEGVSVYLFIYLFTKFAMYGRLAYHRA